MVYSFCARVALSLVAALLLGAAAPPALAEAVLLDFYLPTCPPCRAMAPTVDRLKAEGLPIRKIDGSREPALAQRFGVSSYPSFVMTVDGRETGRVVGMSSYGELRGMIDAAATATRPAAAAMNAPTDPSAVGVVPVAGSFTRPGAEGDRTFAVGQNLGAGRPAPRPTTQPRSATGGAAPSAGDAGLLNATVRFRIEDGTGRSYGTGTVIDARAGEALVVTCAHLFHDGPGEPLNPNQQIFVELFEATGAGVRIAETTQGQVVRHDFDADVALVSIRTTRPTGVAPVVASPTATRIGDTLKSVGCDLGADPTVRSGAVVDLDRYHGAPNIEVTGAPIQGRSGGGLFNARGELVGVCFAADEEANEGLYTGIAAVHAELDAIQLSEIYRGSGGLAQLASVAAPPAAAAVMATPEPDRLAASSRQADSGWQAEPTQQATPAQLASEPASRMAPVSDWPAPERSEPVIRGQSPAPAASDLSRLAPVERATLEEIAARASDSEVVLLIRPKTPDGQTEVITIDSASSRFVETVRAMRR
ncbi:Thioredoxin [Pseudobythopirellula maris]|uniref:Thioredoxin n=1 Tax=Pseudobythopirellula maris TaxID=2527991 RepID=A0A5C5ZMU4_9BACT|nr:trypsin-like peptidase domain-containing protein [Pseudobythopirellula maris]TWT88749.1 Thioredoxin [Pseudobythopirellula maris]